MISTIWGRLLLSAKNYRVTFLTLTLCANNQRNLGSAVQEYCILGVAKRLSIHQCFNNFLLQQFVTWVLAMAGSSMQLGL